MKIHEILCLLIFKRKFKLNSIHNVIHKTFEVFGCPKVACSRDGARDFFLLFTGESNVIE